MAYKSLLTVATSTSGLATTLAAAARLALQSDGHLDALAIGVDMTQIGYAAVGAGAVLLADGLDRAEADAQATKIAIQHELDGATPTLRQSVEHASVPLGLLTDLVGARARYADLVVLGLPYGAGRGVADEAVVEAALFNGMAPVLVVPPAGLPSADPRRVVVAWDQSREAMLAARLALPFLMRAEGVTILVVDPPVHGPERSDPGGLLCQMLVRHGVRAEVSVVAKALPRVSDVLTRYLRDTSADLMVMGAYGHSRFREAILGGATRDMLEHAEVPVFLAH